MINDIIEPLDNDILVHSMDTGEKTLSSGIITLDDSSAGFGESGAKNARGIRSRWATVYKIGKNVDYVSVGDKVLVEHGRWTYAFDLNDNGNALKIQKIDVDAVLLVQASYEKSGASVRSKSLSSQQRTEIAKKAASARWG